MHFVADELMSAALLAVCLVGLLPAARVSVPGGVRAWTAAHPQWLFVLEGMLLAEVAGYWGHRATHEVGFLWRFHSIHHTIETMDWLAPNRRHPVDMALARASVIVPVVAFGFGLPTLAAHFAVRRFQGLLVHANVRLDAGFLTWLVATPEFHHWHHADEPAAVNKNDAGQLALVDWAFGSLYLPRPTWPDRYGCEVAAPDGYFAQLLFPFRRRRGVESTSRSTPSAGRRRAARGAQPLPAVTSTTVRATAAANPART